MHNHGADGLSSRSDRDVGAARDGQDPVRYTVVIPVTTGVHLAGLLSTLDVARGPRPVEVIVSGAHPARARRTVPNTRLDVRILPSVARGQSTARNLGWRAGRTEWIVFLDEDVLVRRDWPERLNADLLALSPECAASTGRAGVTGLPAQGQDDVHTLRETCPPAETNRNYADAAYRRSVLMRLGGFDERCHHRRPAALDLSLRLRKAGYRESDGMRSNTFVPRTDGIRTGVRGQQEHADFAVLRAKHGRYWRREARQPKGGGGRHVVTTAAGAAGVGLLTFGRRSTAALASGVWAALTGDLVRRRVSATGARTVRDVTETLAESVLVPPAATVQNLRGRGRAHTPAAVLLDRDNTLIEDVPYLADPQWIRPMPGAEQALSTIRASGVLLGIVTNQSGLARGYITETQLDAVHTRVDELLGPFHTWQICPHGPDEGCPCRKPAPGMVQRANAMLGVRAHRCVVIGDIGSDVRAAQAAGAHAVLVPTARTLSQEVEHARSHAHLAADLPAAARIALELL